MSTATSGSTYTVEPTARHTHTLIFLHGRGDVGFNFGYAFTQLRTSLPAPPAVSSSSLPSPSACASSATLPPTLPPTLPHIFPSLRFLFPTASPRKCSRFDEVFTEWFDTWSLDDVEAQSSLQVEGLHDAVSTVHRMIEEELEMRHIEPEHIFLGGISQGCAVALHVLLTGRWRLGGFVGVAGWMPFCSQVAGEGKGSLAERVQWLRRNLNLEVEGPGKREGEEEGLEQLKTPVYLCHGEDDEKVDIAHGERARDLLRELGMDVEWKSYPEYGHWYKIPDTLDEIAEFWEKKGGLKPVTEEERPVKINMS